MLTGLAPDKDEYTEALDGGEDVDEGLRAVDHRASAFEPSKRFQSAEELRCALRRAGELLGAERAE